MGMKIDALPPVDADGNVLEFGKTYVHVPTGLAGVPSYFVVYKDGWRAAFDFNTEFDGEDISASELSGNLSEEQRARIAVNSFVDNNRDIFKGIDAEQFRSILGYICSNYDMIKTAFPAAFANV